MIGAQLLMETAAELGVEVCFANPGTTEMPMVEALDSTIRPILGLFEGVCTGAADGYGRMAEKPAMALLHLGSGLANGLCNLHIARRAHTPLLIVVGEHSTWHLPYDPPLAMDIEALAGSEGMAKNHLARSEPRRGRLRRRGGRRARTSGDFDRAF
jgi:acetolactate synthase I/II/III large subunit